MVWKIEDTIKKIESFDVAEEESEAVDTLEVKEENTFENSEKVRRIAGIHINETGVELLIGNVVYYIIGQIIILFAAKERLYLSLGFLAGVIISMIMTIHMIISVEQALSYNENGAGKHMKKTAIIRMVGCGIILVLIGFTKIVDIIGTLIGIMALKVSAYLQPFTHKVLVRKSKGKGR